MATNTYVALDKVTLASAASSITFSSIPSTYTDLVIVVNLFSSANNNVSIRFNGDSGTNYSTTYLSGNTTGAVSGRDISSTALGVNWTGTTLGGGPITGIFNVMNYSNSTTFKSAVSRYSGTGTSNLGEATASVGLWRNTAAITSIAISGSVNFSAGSTFSLYGIKVWSDETTPKATGGYVYSDSSYWYHAFPFSSTFTPNQSLTCDILQVAGGGGGGQDSGGGGGAGGLLYFASQSLSATGYSVTVGAGGKGSISYAGKTNGVNSQFASLTASVGGGQGGGFGAYNPSTGGSGGGASGGGGSTIGASGTSGQGNSGGNSFINGGIYPGGGGGGAGGAGLSPAANTSPAAAGGIGVSTYSSWGIATQTGHNVGGTIYYAGGGGGSTSIPGAGGLGGGGNGSGDGSGTYFPAFSQHGLVSTGGGGGGASQIGATAGGNGGSGIVIVRYAK